MSVAELSPDLETIENQPSQRDFLQQYLGSEVVLAADVRIETFYRDHVKGYRELTHLRTEAVIGFQTLTEEGERRREVVIATAPDDQNLLSFTMQTGISWQDAKTWTSHTFHA